MKALYILFFMMQVLIAGAVIALFLTDYADWARLLLIALVGIDFLLGLFLVFAPRRGK